MMKKFVVFFCGLMFFSCAKKQDILPSIILTNPSSFERIDEPIIISQDKIDSIVGHDNEHSIYFEDEKGVKIPFQKDNIDGKTEYSLSINFKVEEVKRVFIKTSETEKDRDFIPFTNVYLGKDDNADGVFEGINSDLRNPNHLPGAIPVLYQAEGISWENDKVGFRSYWDKRNGKDIWGKTTDKMVLDSIGLPNTKSYHEIQSWGSDILKVGNSLGAGAIAMKKDGKLFRLGGTTSATFKVLTEGPVRTVFSFDYKGWDVEGETFDIIETISIWKGKYGYKSDLKLIGSTQKMVSGIVNINLENDSLYNIVPNLSKTVLYTFGKQTEFKDNLGLGLIVNANEFVAVNTAPNTGTGKSIDGNSPISHTYYAEMKSKNNHVSFYFFAGWERTNKQFSTRKSFEEMLINEANKLDNSIIVK